MHPYLGPHLPLQLLIEYRSLIAPCYLNYSFLWPLHVQPTVAVVYEFYLLSVVTETNTNNKKKKKQTKTNTNQQMDGEQFFDIIQINDLDSIWHVDISKLMDESVSFYFIYFQHTCTISLCSSSFSFINFWYRSSSSFEIPASGLYFDSALSCGCRTTSITCAINNNNGKVSKTHNNKSTLAFIKKNRNFIKLAMDKF